MKKLILSGLFAVLMLNICASIPEDVKKNYLGISEKIGFDISALIWVEHNNK